MTEEVVKKPIVVGKFQGTTDTVTAGFRLVLVILSTAPAAALLVRKGDLIGLYDYFHTEPGIALGGALSGLAALLFGLYKSWKRGAQLSSAATDHRVPDEVVTTTKEATGA
jgi:hypothetical protein